MQYRQLGKTGLRVSEVGFGTGMGARLIMGTSPKERTEAVAKALELGVNYFDTSPNYAKGVAETNLGQALKELGARPVILTKVEILPDQFDDLAGAVVQSIESSLRRLGIDYVDIAQIHNSPAFWRTPDIPWGWTALSLGDYLGPKGALEGLERARRDGKARFFGFGAPMESPDRASISGHATYVRLMKTLFDVEVARALFQTGEFSVLNVEYNLLNPTAGMPKPQGLEVASDNMAILNLAREFDVGAVIYRPLARGTLTEAVLRSAQSASLPGEGRQETANVNIRAGQVKSLGFLSRPGEQTLSEATYKFILMHPGVTTVIGGFAAFEHIEEAAGVSGTAGLTPQEMARVEAAWRANFGVPCHDRLD